MKVLCFIDNLGSGGAQRQMVNLALLLKEQGHEVRFLMYGKADFFRSKLDEANIKVDVILSSNYLMRIINVRKYIRAGWQDVVISFLHTPNFLASIASTGKRKWKLIINERSCLEDFFYSIRGRIFAHCYRRADAFVCNSQNAQSMWKKYYPQYASMISTIYNPVLISDMPPETKRSPYPLHMVVAASYQLLKNIDGLIEALNLMDSAVKEKIVINWYGNKNVTFGGVSIYDKSKEKISAYGFENTIFLHDATKDILKIMAKEADIVGLFSHYEGLPNAICEGITLGKPIIMSRVSDYETLVDGNGFLCDSEDPQSICDALTKMILLSESQRREMGRCSEEKAKRLFSPEAIVEQWIQLISNIS